MKLRQFLEQNISIFEKMDIFQTKFDIRDTPSYRKNQNWTTFLTNLRAKLGQNTSIFEKSEIE